jgi:hypothetical protein
VSWNVIEVDRLSASTVRDLLDNRVAAIRRPGFLDAETCARSRTALFALGDWGHYEGAVPEGAAPPLGRLGITQYEHHGDKAMYFQSARAAIASRRQRLQAADLPDPLHLFIDELAACWPSRVGVAEDDGQPYFAGVFRLTSETLFHADWGPRDGPGWDIERVQAQLGWNLYYSVPEAGGDLIVHDYPWRQEVEVHARLPFYDYDPAAFADTDRVAVRPNVGELVLFNARNMHAVSRTSGAGDRLSVGSFVGETDDGSLIIWS